MKYKSLLPALLIVLASLLTSHLSQAQEILAEVRITTENVTIADRQLVQQMQNDMQSGGTTGSISTGMDRGNSGARGLDRADQVAGSNGQDGRSDAREAMGGSSGNPGGEQSGGKGSDNGKGNDGDKSK